MVDSPPDTLELSARGYEIVETLSVNREGGRITYLAKTRDGVEVVLKRFGFAGVDASWAGYAELQREASVLRELTHPRLPDYLDSFASASGFYLVQAWLEVPSLGERTSFSPLEVKTIALSVLDILAYLQDRLPPVIHRDVKPGNVLVDALRALFGLGG